MVTMPQGGVRVVSGWGVGAGLEASGESCMADNVKPNVEKDQGLAPILNCWGICRELSN
ncbi:NAD-dependent aldehyde dehydrogenases [Synechocystis sp. PCC 6803]|nr:NAD-dependent aldehyde dehydrogenases [Synechocystis sp. PCC 6803] [Bacillus subtilis BEST7613]